MQNSSHGSAYIDCGPLHNLVVFALPPIFCGLATLDYFHSPKYAQLFPTSILYSFMKRSCPLFQMAAFFPTSVASSSENTSCLPYPKAVRLQYSLFITWFYFFLVFFIIRYYLASLCIFWKIHCSPSTLTVNSTRAEITFLRITQDMVLSTSSCPLEMSLLFLLYAGQ
jgi:hypothetical protein